MRMNIIYNPEMLTPFKVNLRAFFSIIQKTREILYSCLFVTQIHFPGIEMKSYIKFWLDWKISLMYH